MQSISLQTVAVAVAVTFLAAFPVPYAESKEAGTAPEDPPSIRGRSVLISQSAIAPVIPHFQEGRIVNRRVRVIVTAYSSTVDQTDDTPFITASGTSVREGIVAANFVPFGTKIKIPDLYGDRIFVVEDRMHTRKRNMVDIWFPTREEAIDFGAMHSTIEILEG